MSPQKLIWNNHQASKIIRKKTCRLELVQAIIAFPGLNPKSLLE